MSEEHTLRVGIDGTAAEAGSRVVARSMEEVVGAAARMNTGVTASQGILRSLGGVALSVKGLLGGMFALFTVAGFVAQVREAIQIIDQFKTSLVQTAATITSFQSGPNKDMPLIFKESMEYAEQLAIKMEEIDARSFANAQTLSTISQQYLLQRQAVLDITDPKQVKAFEAIGNAVMTIAGGNSIQVFTESRALFEGMARPGATLAMQLEKMVEKEGKFKSLKEAFIGWGREGKNVLEELGKRLEGFSLAGDYIEQTLGAVASSWDTIKNILLRGGFEKFFQDIVSLGQRWNDLMREHADSISTAIHKSYMAVRGVFGSIFSLIWTNLQNMYNAWNQVFDLIQGLAAAILPNTVNQHKTLADLVSDIFNGWSFLLGVIFPGLIEKISRFGQLFEDLIEFGVVFVQTIGKAIDAVLDRIGGVGEVLMMVITGNFQGAADKVKDIFSPGLFDEFAADAEKRLGAIGDNIGGGLGEIFSMDDFFKRYDEWEREKTDKGPIAVPDLGPQAPDLDNFKLQQKTELAQMEWRNAQDERELAREQNLIQRLEALNEMGYQQGTVALQEYLDTKNTLVDENAAIQEQIAENNLTVAQTSAQQIKDQLRLTAKANYDAAQDRVAEIKTKIEITPEDNELQKALDFAISDVTRLREQLEKPIASPELFKANESVEKAQQQLEAIQAQRELQKGILNPEQDIQAQADQNRQWAQAEIQLLQMGGALEEVARRKAELDNADPNSFINQIAQQAEDGVAGADRLLDRLERIRELEAARARIDAQAPILQLEVDLEQDVWEKPLLQAERAHEKVMDMKEEELKALEEGTEAHARKIQEMALLEQKYTQDTHQQKLSLWSSEASFYGGLLQQTAAMVEGTSEESFEAQKALAIASTVVNTGAAIMNQLASYPGPPGWIAAGVAAAAGAVQLSNIMSTSYGGGGSIAAVQGGDFGGSSDAGGTGTVLGDPTATSQSVQNSNELLEDIHADEYAELQAITRELKQMNMGFKGLASSLVRAGGDFSKIPPGVNLGSDLNYELPNFMTNWLPGEKLLGGMMDNPIGQLLSLPADIFDAATDFVMGGIFGKTKTSHQASGVSLGQQSFGDLLGGESMPVRGYDDIKIKDDGGWFKSTKSWTETHYKSVDNLTRDMFTDIFVNMAATFEELAGGLGTEVQDVLDYEFAVGKINLKGLKGEEIGEKIAEVMSYAGDKAAEALFAPLLMTYQQVNEGAMETVVRLMVEKFIVIDTLAKTSNKAEGDIIALSQSLIQLSGGLEDFIENVESFYDAFTGMIEKQIDNNRFLNESIDDFDMDLPGTREGWKDLVSSIDLSEPADIAERYYSEFNEWSEKLAEEMAADRWLTFKEDFEALGLERVGMAFGGNSAERWYEKINEGNKYYTRRAEHYGILPGEGEASEATQRGYDSAKAALDAQIAQYEAQDNLTQANQEAYTTLLELSEAADQYYSFLEDGVDAYHNAFSTGAENLVRLRQTITEKLDEGLDVGNGLAFSNMLLHSKDRMEAIFEMIDMEDGGKWAVALAGVVEDVADFYSQVEGMEQDFRSAFYSEEKNKQFNYDELVSALDDVNLRLPETKEGWISTVEALDAAGKSRELEYFTMLELTDAAATYYETLESATKSFKDMTLDAIDVQIAATQALKNLSTGNLSTLSPEEKYNQLAGTVVTTADRALGGDVEAGRNLPGLITEWLTASKEYFGANANYADDFSLGMDWLSQLSGLDATGGVQVSQIEQQLEGLSALQTAITDGNLEQVQLLSEQVALSQQTVQLLAGYLSEASPEGAMASYAVGTPSVPGDMTANIHEGEMIMDREAADALRKYGIRVYSTGGGDNKGVEERLDRMTSVLKENSRQLSSINNKARLAANS